jgi:hypothetical protein
MSEDEIKPSTAAESMDDEMARWYQQKQDDIDATLAAIQQHQADGHVRTRCQDCRRLAAKLEKARYYGD